MFERILERILLAKIGKFIIGLDKQQLKVAVWQGDIVLENVHLRPEVLLMWQLPLILTYGRVGRLVVRIPWTKLMSEPVEIILEGLYIIIAPQEKDRWDYSEEGNIMKRKEYIEVHEARKASTFIQAANPEEELQKKSFLDKLTARVIDNLKLSIKDIHIRFEYHLDKVNFSTGITLEGIECYTTNAYWEREFTDRHQSGSASLAIYKIVNINGLHMYWTCEDLQNITNSSEAEVIEFLCNKIHNKVSQESVLAPSNFYLVSAQMRIVHNNDLSNFDIPKYSVDLVLPEIALRYEKAQFHDTVRLFEYLTDYNKFLLKIEHKRKFRAFSPLDKNPRSLWRFAIDCIIKTIRQRKNRTLNLFRIPRGLLGFYEENFKRIYRRIVNNHEIEEDDEVIYDKIIYVNNLDSICEWVSQVQTEIHEEATKKQLESKPSKWKFWNTFRKSSKPSTEIFVDHEDSREIPKSYVWMILSISLLKGSLELSKLKEITSDHESLLFTFDNLYFEGRIRLQGGSFLLVLDNLILQSTGDSEKSTIFEKVRPSEEPLLNLNLDISPIDSQVSYALILNTQPISVDYTPEALILITTFFMVPETQESVKTAAWDTLQNLQDTTKATLTDILYGDIKYSIQIKANGPHIKFPALSSGEFLLNLGCVEVKNSSGPESSEYDSLDFTLSGIKLAYQNNTEWDSVIPEFKINWKLSFLKAAQKLLKWRSIAGSLDFFPDFIFEGELARFELIMSPNVYHNLKSVNEVFDLRRGDLGDNMGEIMKKSVMSSNIKRRSKNVQQWQAFFGVLAGGYIYFFVTQDSKSPISYYYIKDCSIEDIYNLGVHFCIRLRNRYGECVLSFDSELELHFWKRTLNEQILEFESYKSVAKDIVEDVRTANKQRVRLAFNISSVEIILTNSEKVKLVKFELARLSTDVLINPYDSAFSVKLLKLLVIDMVRVNKEHFTVLAQSVTEGKDLISIGFRQYSPKSPSYKNKDQEIEVAMSALELNWNPDFISTIFNFFEFADYNDPQRTKSKKLIVKPDHVLLAITLNLESVSMYLNNVKQNLSIGLITISQLNSVVLFKDGGTETSGTLGNLQIYDLTNYPKTVLALEKKIKLFSVRKDAPVMLEFKIVTYLEENLKKQENISSEVDVKMYSVNLYYYNQPVMRIIDYLMYKVLGILDTTARVKNVYTFSSAYRLSTLIGASAVQSIKTEAIQRKLGFTSIRVTMTNPIIKLYPRPGFEEYFLADLGDVYIDNRQELDPSRGPEDIWVDMFKINMLNITIRSKEQKILSDFDLLLFFHRPVPSTFQSLDPEIDKSYTIRAKCERLRLTFSQNDLTLLLKLMDLNLTYDDQLESYINPKAQDNSYSPSSKFLYFCLQAKVFSVLFTFEEEELAEIFCANQELQIWKYNNGSSVLNFTAQHFLGLIPEEAVNSENPEHAEIAEAIFSVSLDNIRNFEDFEDDDMQLSYVLFGPIGNVAPDKHAIQIDVNTMSDGAKAIIIEITQLRVNLHIAAILQLQNVLYYGLPDYSTATDTPYDYMHKYRPQAGMTKKEVKTQYLAPQLEIKLSIEEPILLLPSIIHQRVLVVQSDFSYSFFRDSESMYLLGTTPNTVKSFEATHLEIFTCKLTELHKHSFTDIVKRKILEPVEVIYKSIQSKVSPNISSYEVKYYTGAFLFTLSHKDLMLIGNVLGFQQEILQRENDLINALQKTFGQKEDFLPRMSLDERNLMLRLSSNEGRNSLEFEATDERDYSPSIRSMTCQMDAVRDENTSSTTISISGATLLLIYDTSLTYSPIVDTNATDIIFTVEEIGSNIMRKAGAVIKSNFYNAILDTWEPFIEQVSIQLESMTSPENNPETQGIIIIEKSMTLNLNFSEIMIKMLLALAKGWRVKEDKLVHEVVSPISIQNFSGCEILIEKNNYNNKHVGEFLRLKNLENKYYEVESMKMKTINLSEEYLNVTVLNEERSYSTCEHIPINKVQTLTHLVRTEKEAIPIVMDIELKDTCKVFTVRSPIVIRNETAYDLKVLFSRKSISAESLIKSQESMPVPIPYINFSFAVKPTTLSTSQWALTRFDGFKKDGMIQEIQIDHFYIIIYVAIDKYNTNKITLCLRPPLIFRNQLPRNLTLQVFYNSSKESHEIVLLPNGFHYEHSQSASVSISSIFQIENFQASKLILLISQREKPPKAINLYDYRDDIMQIQLDHSRKGSQTFTFYCAFTLINSTSLPLNFYYRKSGLSQVVGGQNYINTIIPCSPTRKIAVAMGKERSDWMHVATVGTEDVIEFESEESEGCRKKYQLCYSVSLAKVVEDELVFSKIVLICPRYILINNMKQDVLIKQYRMNKGEFVLEKNSRVPFYWPDKDHPELIRIKVNGDWKWSGQFNLANIGTFTIQNRNTDMINHYMLIKVEVKLIERSFYVIFEQEDDKFCNYRIENHSLHYKLKAYQKGCREEMRFLDPDSLISFAWSKPQRDNIIVIEFFKETYQDALPTSQTFSFNKIDQNFTIPLKDSRRIYAKIECEGPTKILKFSDHSLQSKKQEDYKIKTQYTLSIPSLGLSVIEYYREDPTELIYLSASNILLFAQETSKQWEAELLISYMQIDNQASVPAIYPVILSPGKTEEKNVLHISVLYNFASNPNIYCFDKCEFLMQELAIKLESKVLQKTVEMATRLFFNSSAVVKIIDVYERNQKPVWMCEDRIELDKLYYFASLALSPIKLSLSLIPIKEDEDDADVYGTVSKALGMAITTIDMAPVKLNSLEMTDVFGSQWQILTAFKAHYGKQLVAELLKLIGHAEILGNPIGLLNNLGTGVKDFFYEPAHGIIEGPLSAGRGLIKGTGSLLKNTVEGTFDTFSKLANSMATGLTTLTQDNKYIIYRQRDQAMNKPRNIIDGVEMGVKSLLNNLGQGITGIVSEPVRGYKKDKFTGMIIGGVRGLSGLIVRPVAGVLDAAGRAAEGIRNTAVSHNYFGTSDRKRPPRVFYGKNSTMKPYDSDDALLFNLVSEIKKGRYAKEKFVGCVEGFDLHGKHWLVYVFVERILLLDGKKKKVKWDISTSSVKECELQNSGLSLVTTPSEFKKTKGKSVFLFPIGDLRLIRTLNDRILEVLNGVN